MKTFYEEPTVTVHEFSIEDILTTSGGDAEDSYGNGLDLPGVGWGS